MFAFLTLVTGAFWGKPMWGAWWVWDARLTSMLILLFFYLGVIALANGFDQPERGSRPAALLALVGVINVPIVKFSVDWWNTLHQPASLLRSGGVSIDQAMLVPLLLMLAGMHCYFAVIVILRMKAILAEGGSQACSCGRPPGMAADGRVLFHGRVCRVHMALLSADAWRHGMACLVQLAARETRRRKAGRNVAKNRRQAGLGGSIRLG
ncbi:MAG: hypothetical protein CM15mP115_09750 [Alphaproteobacteria bacterium]|nr:MAG: hypothetical protein CM15mP115_09750 [Alphaproteobacteria bacterium]